MAQLESNGVSRNQTLSVDHKDLKRSYKVSHNPQCLFGILSLGITTIHPEVVVQLFCKKNGFEDFVKFTGKPEPCNFIQKGL